MNNPVLMLTRNNLELTKRAVESVHQQTIPTWMCVIDNDSTDGTYEWAKATMQAIRYSPQIGVSAGWNVGLGILFALPDIKHVLVVNNDLVLPHLFYAELLSYDEPFITGVAVDSMVEIDALNRKTEKLRRWKMERQRLDPHPDFSAFLIRRDAWEKIGPFNEMMKHYASDCDMHVRGHRLGVRMSKVAVPYYHESSSTINRASPTDQAILIRQADEDRQEFERIHGCLPGTPEYEKLFE